MVPVLGCPIFRSKLYVYVLQNQHFVAHMVDNCPSGAMNIAPAPSSIAERFLKGFPNQIQWNLKTRHPNAGNI
jgi:hypothetical protein